MNAPDPIVANIQQAISLRGFYFADPTALNQLIEPAESDPAHRLRSLQCFAMNNGWRVVARDNCTAALFLAL